MSTFIRPFVFVFALLLLAYILITYRKWRNKGRAGKHAQQLFYKLDEKYVNYIRKKLPNEIVDKDTLDLDKDKIMNEALIILKPEIDAVISLIKFARQRPIDVEIKTELFKNAGALTENYLPDKKSNYPNQQKVEKMLNQAFRDSVDADLTKRIFEYKSI